MNMETKMRMKMHSEGVWFKRKRHGLVSQLAMDALFMRQLVKHSSSSENLCYGAKSHRRKSYI